VISSACSAKVEFCGLAMIAALLLLAVVKVFTSRVARSTRAAENPADWSDGRP
jgi:hypothetical protein